MSLDRSVLGGVQVLGLVQQVGKRTVNFSDVVKECNALDAAQGPSVQIRRLAENQ